MKTITFKLPSGTSVTMRECTGNDEFAAAQKFLGKKPDERQFESWDTIARTCSAIGGIKPGPTGYEYEQILQLSTKDLKALLLAFNQMNAPTVEELEDVKSFFAPGSSSPASPKPSTSPSKN